MSGYPGDLSDSQALALEQMKKRIVDIWSETFADHFLLRWLRAREFDVSKAENMLREDMIWRSKNNVDTMLETYKCPEVLRRYYTGGLFNHDRDGHPVFILPFGDGDYRGILQCVPKEDFYQRVAYSVEEIMMDMRTQTAKMGRLIDTFTAVFDFDNFSLRQLYCWQVMKLIQDLLALYESHYPETLRRCIIINAPAFFPVFWKLIRPFMTKRTIDKVEIYSREGWQTPLLEYIDPSQLPVHWGGELVGPDGNTKCSHKIGIGGEVPQELYLKNGPRVSSNPKSTTRLLQAGESLEVPVNVTSTASVLEWKFQTNCGQDIGFKLAYTANNATSAREITEKTRVRCDKIPESGYLECTETGTYTITFDNSSSWFTRKEISYVIRVYKDKAAFEEQNSVDEGFESETI